MKLDQRITFITLGVSNLQTSIDFYEKCFGWKKSEISSDNMVLFTLNGIHLALYPREALAEDALVSPEGEGFKGFTLAHNLWSEEEVNNAIESLREMGVAIIKEPQKVFWGGYSSYIADPDGFLWEIAYNPFLERG